MASLPMVASGGGGNFLIQEGDVTCSRNTQTRVYTDFRPEHIITYATDMSSMSDTRCRINCAVTTAYGSANMGGIQTSANATSDAGIHPIPQTANNNGVDTIYDDGFRMAKMTSLGLVYHWIAIAHKS